MSGEMQKIVLASRPVGAPVDENFRLETAPMPTPEEGEVLIKVHYMSLDPYMRGRMDDAKSYAAPVPVGGTMEGSGVGEVVATNSDKFAVGDMALGMFGWASHALAKANELRKLDKTMPVTPALGVLGMPGFTGWYGLNKLGRPKAGETLVVAAATGPVGSMVGQLAKLAGLRVIGIAGGPEKCRIATETFGFDACLDHRAYEDARSLRKDLADLCPDGVDIYFENVGGKVLEAVWPLLNTFARVPVCGMISWYNAGALGGNASSDGLTGPGLWRSILVKQMSVNGYIISNHFDLLPEFLGDVLPKVLSGEVKYLEDVAEGLENAPRAFMEMLGGGNTGKQIVKLI